MNLCTGNTVIMFHWMEYMMTYRDDERMHGRLHGWGIEKANRKIDISSNILFVLHDLTI